MVEMSDLSAIDRELGDLGEPPANLAALVERDGLADRSLERVDGALAALAEGVALAPSPVARPPAPPALQDTVVDQDTPLSVERQAPPSAPAPRQTTASQAVDAELDEFLAEEASDERALSEAPEEDDAWADEAPTSAVAIPAEGELEAYDGMVAPPAELQAASEAPPERRSSMKELLRQDLDPADFPQTSHPPPPPAGSPEAQAVAAADAELADEDDFELLVDDADIIEIEDDELELIEDD